MNPLILWVEDDVDDVLLIGRAILKAGLDHPVVARDGSDAVDYLSASGKYIDRDVHPLPALILLDLKLPKLTGFEVLEWIRAQPGIRRIPVIVFTSSQQRSDIDRAYALGANAYLVKSVDHAELVESLKRVRAFWFDLNMHPTLMFHESADAA